MPENSFLSLSAPSHLPSNLWCHSSEDKMDVPCFRDVDKTCCKPAESLLGSPFHSQSRCSGTLSSDHRVFIFSPSFTCEVFQTGFGHRPSLFIFLAVGFTLQIWAGHLQLGGHGIRWKPPDMWNWCVRMECFTYTWHIFHTSVTLNTGQGDLWLGKLCSQFVTQAQDFVVGAFWFPHDEDLWPPSLLLIGPVVSQPAERKSNWRFLRMQTCRVQIQS